ncbi:DUF736 family protein [Rhizobium sp. BK176]|uniref:DUF736 family protein n=1 Tax=Rhizobium sp. BK176 TaxID=2587071 RepID=UPI00387029A1
MRQASRHVGFVQSGSRQSATPTCDYISVKLDDPSFAAPIYATLAEVQGQEGLQLIWSRSARR